MDDIIFLVGGVTGRAWRGGLVHLWPHTSILSVSYSRFTIRVVDAKKKQQQTKNKTKKNTEIYLPLSNATQLSNAPLGVWPCWFMILRQYSFVPACLLQEGGGKPKCNL